MDPSFRAELPHLGLHTAGRMWSLCALTLGEPSPSKTAGGGYDMKDMRDMRGLNTDMRGPNTWRI